MSNYREKNVVYALNSYVWKLVEANLQWEKWKSVPPIIPVQQQPEFMQSGKPFIVYGSSSHPPTHLYRHQKEVVSYMVYAVSSTEVNRTIELIFDTFQRQDEAAVDVNDWLAEEAKHRAGEHRGVYFTTITSTMAEKAEEPSNEEGGFLAGMVLVEMKYVEEKNTIKTSGFVY